MSCRGMHALREPATVGCGPWELPRAPIAASLARRQLAGALPDLPTQVVQEAQLLTSELVTNALMHGQGLITMSIVRDEQSLTVRIADEASEGPVVREHDLGAQAGRGLRLVEELTTRWGTEPVVGGHGGKVVWFSMGTTSPPH